MAANSKVKKSEEPALKRFGRSFIGFFVELKAETKRITWPSKKDTKKATVAVLIFVSMWVAYVSIFDGGLGYVYKMIFTVK